MSNHRPSPARNRGCNPEYHQVINATLKRLGCINETYFLLEPPSRGNPTDTRLRIESIHSFIDKIMELIRTNLVRQALDSDLVVSLLKGTVPRLDKALLRGSRGWLNTGLQTVVLLRTTGAKSGVEREIATLCMPVGRDLVLVGSNWGQDRDPAWIHNLRAHSTAHITYRGFSGEVEGRELKGRERSSMWQHLVHYNPQYGVYQNNTQRRLPVFLMHRPD